MAVKIRMNRMGRTNRPFYRIIVADSRSSRDGRAIERLGHYDPILKKEKNWVINRERAAYWLSVGAQPSETVRSFLKKEGIWPREKAVEFYNSIKDKPAAVEPTAPELPADIEKAVKVEPVVAEAKAKAKPVAKAKAKPVAKEAKAEPVAEAKEEPVAEEAKAEPVAEVKEEPVAEEVKAEPAPEAAPEVAPEPVVEETETKEEKAD